MKEKSTGVKRRKYDASFKQEVLSMVFNGRPVSEVARGLGIGENIIYRWKSSSHNKQPVTTAPAAGSSSGDSPTTAAAASSEDSLLTLHKRIHELEQERDILKKALGIFSRQT